MNALRRIPPGLYLSLLAAALTVFVDRTQWDLGKNYFVVLGILAGIHVLLTVWVLSRSKGQLATRTVAVVLFAVGQQWLLVMAFTYLTFAGG
jgi:hypothetical protein